MSASFWTRGGKRSATPLSHARKVTGCSGVLVRSKAPSPLRSAGALQSLRRETGRPAHEAARGVHAASPPARRVALDYSERPGTSRVEAARMPRAESQPDSSQPVGAKGVQNNAP